MLIKIHNWLTAETIEMTDEVRITRILAIYSSLVNSLTHFLMMLLFYWLNSRILIYYNIGAVLFFLGLGTLAYRNKLNLFWILSAFEFVLHSWMATIELGQISNFHLYIMVSSGLWFLLAAPLWFKFGLTFFSTVFMIALVYIAPIYPSEGYDIETITVIGRINNVFQFFLLALIAGVYSLIVKNMRHRLDIEYARSEALLHNILPHCIASRLKENPDQTIADGFQECSVLFSDIVNFTPLSAKLSAHELVEILNQIFSIFDELVDQHQLEKIKTIGDAYMVASGVPKLNPDHAFHLADFALDMQREMTRFRIESGHDINLRMGIHSGSVVAGIIGKRKFAYDLWGDTVNIASRMESHGKPGMIHISQKTHTLLKGQYEMEARGEQKIKGKGTMNTYFLIKKLEKVEA
jgi:adenylate cyclase